MNDELASFKHRAAWLKPTMEIFMVDGQTMDNHGFRQLSNLMLGLESNPGDGIFIFLLF